MKLLFLNFYYLVSIVKSILRFIKIRFESFIRIFCFILRSLILILIDLKQIIVHLLNLLLSFLKIDLQIQQVIKLTYHLKLHSLIIAMEKYTKKTF